MTGSKEPRRGLVMIFTGDGKGKTTAALGLGLRAWGQGMRVLVLQFLKSPSWPAGEREAVRRLEGFEIRPLGLGFVRGRGEDELRPHREAARQALTVAREAVAGGEWDLVVLDEIFVALSLGLLAEEDLHAILDARSPSLHLALTGRGAPETVVARADLVTEMREVKHHYTRGIKAQKGIEY